MNLVEIQENLKDLPTQAIMAYANGTNPEVPPYMALGELNRRKSMEQRATQPPTQSVKEQLESEMGLPSVMPPPVNPGAPQGMPPGAPPGMAQGMARPPMPQGMPQGMPQQMARPPQMAPQAAPQMAAGGLTNIPMKRDIFKYAPGGIVAFAGGELVPGGGGEMGEDTAGEAEARANMGVEGPPVTAQLPGRPAQTNLSSLLPAALENLSDSLAGKSSIPAPVDKETVRQELIAKNPQMAEILSKMPGSTLMALVKKLQDQNEASKAQFKEGEGQMGLAALSNALISAGEATRGQKGMGIGEAFGAFGKSYNTATADEIKRKQAQQALERQQEIEVSKLQSDTEAMQRAFAEGNVNEAMDYKKSIADRQAKIDALKSQTGKEVLTLQGQEQQRQDTASHYKMLENQARLNYEETLRHNASQAEIEKARLEFQRATKNAQLALDAERLAQLRDAKPSASEKIAAKIEQQLTRGNSEFAELNKRIASLSNEELDSPEGQWLIARRDAYRNAAYEAAKLQPGGEGLIIPKPANLPKRSDYVKPPVEEPSAFSKWWNGQGNSISSMGSETPSEPQLPASRANQFKVLR